MIFWGSYMAHKRKEFSEIQKASIYARDRATCAFSGISLWILDNGIRPNWEMDWVDHVRPSAAGGDASLGNGVCASNTFNAKKRDNTSDNVMFFEEGKISESYIRVFGLPPQSVLDQLNRLKYLEPADWFFNRCIGNVFVGLDWRCDLEFKGVRYKRDDMYWFKAGWKRLQVFQRKRPQKTIESRGLVRSPFPFGAANLLRAESIDSFEDYINWIEDIFPVYHANSLALYSYFKEKSLTSKKTLVDKALKDKKINPVLAQSLLAHYDCHKY